MRVAVIGAGLIGVTTASELAAEGHEVTVFERRGSIAAEGSFAHAGLVAPGLLVPWADPSFADGLLERSLRRDGGISVASRLDPSALRWLWRQKRASHPKQRHERLAHFHRLATFSHQRFRALSTALEFDHEASVGCLVLFRDAKSAARIHADLSIARELGLQIDALDADQCRAIEPGLNADTPFFGGVHMPQASGGNARQFTLLMRNEAQRLGVTFRLQSHVVRLQPGPRPGLSWATVDANDASSSASYASSSGRLLENALTQERFDAVIACTGNAADLLGRARIPMLPVHGWSLTAPMRVHEAHPDHGPRSVVIDAGARVAIGRMGSRIRVSGGVRLGGPPPRQDAPDELYRSLDDWFPGALHTNQVQRWCGARPTTPDGLPLIGASGLEGIWLNLGHGAAGWSLACGAARLLVDTLARREPPVPGSAFEPARWH